LKIIKKILQPILILTILVVVLTVLSGNETYIIYAASAMFIIMGIENTRCWFAGESIGIRAPLEIPANASKPIRFLGLIYAVFLLSIGIAILV